MQYFILASSKNRSQLFEVIDDVIQPHAIQGMPRSIADAWRGMERESGDHNQRNANDVTEQEENEYLHSIAKSLHEFLHGHGAPLVFAGVEEAYGMFKKFDQSGCLLERHIQGSPDHLTMEELKAKADPIARPEILKRHAAVLEQFGALQGTGRTSVDAAEIASKAAAGKIETLIVAEGAADVRSALADEVRAHRGSVVTVEPSMVPGGCPLAAIIRM